MSEREIPVGVAEIAQRLKVKRATVEKWRARRVLPEPDMVVSGSPLWWWESVESWARETGRL